MRDANAKWRGRAHGAATTALAAAVAVLGATGAAALEERWTVTVEPMILDAYGHDQHVLTIHQLDLDAAPRLDAKTAVALDTDDGPAYRGKVEYDGERWGWGLDFLWWNGSQDAAERTASGGAVGSADQVAFEVADRTFTSSSPGQVLFYRVLEDTDLTMWTLDLYAARALTETPESRLRILLGLRNADFDNDYRAVVGLQGSAGSRLDASSNYGRMMGPLLGLDADVRLRKNTFRGSLRQSLVLGEAELSGSSREFAGAFTEDPLPPFFASETLRRLEDVAIPISELRVQWTYDVTRRVALGLGADTSAWWGVRVPPGVVPIADGDEALHDSDIVFFGLHGVVRVAF